MKEILTEEEKQAMDSVIDAIRKYEAGDTSYEQDMLDVISGIWNYVKYSKIIKRRYRWIITFYKTISKILKSNEESILEDYKSIDEYYSFYCSSVDTLKQYLEIGFKTDEYPDLEAAYLLTIYLSNLEHNMNDYLNEISSIENILKWSGRSAYLKVAA